jgi:hypothetical protein
MSGMLDGCASNYTGHHNNATSRKSSIGDSHCAEKHIYFAGAGPRVCTRHQRPARKGAVGLLNMGSSTVYRKGSAGAQCLDREIVLNEMQGSAHLSSAPGPPTRAP